MAHSRLDDFLDSLGEFRLPRPLKVAVGFGLFTGGMVTLHNLMPGENIDTSSGPAVISMALGMVVVAAASSERLE